jgi:dihydrofolate synthase/folylpolyglutamate synthase
VITPISHDHHQFLGTTLSAIAREKAGILKPGYPCVVARQPNAAMDVIRARAEETGSALFVQDEDWSVSEDAGLLVYEGPMGRLEAPRPVLPGHHQLQNAGLALATLDRLPRFPAAPAEIARGLSDADWPARLQHLRKGPLVEILPVDWELWLDGGHNAAAGEAIADHARSNWSDRPLFLIGGMLNSKNCADFLRPLAPVCETFSAIAIPGEENTVSASDLAAIARSVGMMASDNRAITDALKGLPLKRHRSARVLICGSLYLAGSVLGENT